MTRKNTNTFLKTYDIVDSKDATAIGMLPSSPAPSSMNLQIDSGSNDTMDTSAYHLTSPIAITSVASELNLNGEPIAAAATSDANPTTTTTTDVPYNCEYELSLIKKLNRPKVVISYLKRVFHNTIVTEKKISQMKRTKYFHYKKDIPSYVKKADEGIFNYVHEYVYTYSDYYVTRAIPGASSNSTSQLNMMNTQHPSAANQSMMMMNASASSSNISISSDKGSRK
jgi:hypothetical protein